MASPDIFTQIASLFRNQQPEGDVHVYVLHRFLSSDSTFAPFAKDLSRLYDDKMVTEIWRTSLPKMANPPFFKYPGPKKPSAPDELVKRVADAENYTLREAEEVVALLHQMGQLDSTLTYYGVESVPPKEEEKKPSTRKKK